MAKTGFNGLLIVYVVSRWKLHGPGEPACAVQSGRRRKQFCGDNRDGPRAQSAAYEHAVRRGYVQPSWPQPQPVTSMQGTGYGGQPVQYVYGGMSPQVPAMLTQNNPAPQSYRSSVPSRVVCGACYPPTRPIRPIDLRAHPIRIKWALTDHPW
jgi:hypothetical protein